MVLYNTKRTITASRSLMILERGRVAAVVVVVVVGNEELVAAVTLPSPRAQHRVGIALEGASFEEGCGHHRSRINPSEPEGSIILDLRPLKVSCIWLTILVCKPISLGSDDAVRGALRNHEVE